MPFAPKRPCADLPCPAFAVRAGRCLPHARAHDRERPSWAVRYGADWPAKRGRVLARDPVCTVCGAEPSVEVDHVVAIADGGSLEEENLRGIGRRCHAEKSARERAARTAAARGMGLASPRKCAPLYLGPVPAQPIAPPHMSAPGEATAHDR
jgi:5-methylcytosine-specific restriction enzyme A